MFELTLIIVSLLLVSVGAEQIPDYFKPSVPILTDKNVYSWTEKLRIAVIAPSWDVNRNGIDSIGTQEGNFIKISSSGNSIESYKLTETKTNSGIFVGEVTLTGFSHDANGDGRIDTNPRTGGNGPTNGFLEVERDGGITISFEFADSVILTHSVFVSWNKGEINFAKPTYGLEEMAKIRVVDPDMNLNPEVLDRVIIEISSDSDLAGILVDGIETTEDSGVFDASITFTQNRVSNGNRLFVSLGDSIYAEYEDNTLPPPFSIRDNVEIKTKSKIV